MLCSYDGQFSVPTWLSHRVPWYLVNSISGVSMGHFQMKLALYGELGKRDGIPTVGVYCSISWVSEWNKTSEKVRICSLYLPTWVRISVFCFQTKIYTISSQASGSGLELTPLVFLVLGPSGLYWNYPARCPGSPLQTVDGRTSYPP